MTQSSTAEYPLLITDLQLLLLDLEENLNRTAAQLRHLVPNSSSFDNNNDNDNNSNNNNNNKNNNKSYDCTENMVSSTFTSEDIVGPIEKLQKYVEACEASVNNRLTQVRHQVELAVNVSKTYQKMFPNAQNKLLAAAATTAAATHGPNSLPAAGNQISTGGSICNDNVRYYLSRFVRWDPLEFDRVTNAVAAVAEEAHRQSLTGVGGDVHSRHFTTVIRPPFSSASTLPASIYGSHYMSTSCQSHCRRSLNTVIDRLVLRQLQYDGIRLTTSMEMELGCYDGMTTVYTSDSESVSENLPFDIAIPQEVRRGVMHPFVEHDDSDTNLQQMIHNTYPRTLQWISTILELCSKCSPDGFPSTWNVNNALGASLSSVSGTSFPWNSYDQQSERDVLAQPYFLTEVDTQVQGTNERQVQEGERSRAEVGSLYSDLHPRRVSIPSPLQELPPMTVLTPWSVVASMVVPRFDDIETESRAVDYLQEELEQYSGQQGGPPMYPEDEHEYAGYYTENMEEEEEEVEDEDEAEAEAEAEEEEEVENDNDDDEDDDHNNNNKEEEEDVYVEPLQQGKQSSSNESNAAQLVVLATQRVYVLLSDIVIIWALQRVSEMIAQSKEQQKRELQASASFPPGVNGDNGSLNEGVLPPSATLQKAVDFILAIQRHPLVLWRLEMERGFQKTRRNNKKKTTTTTTTTKTTNNTTNTTTMGNKGSKEKGEKSLDDTTSSPLLLTFCHVLIALGYMPLLWGKQQNEEDDDKKQRVQKQLLCCIAPFLSLWCGAQEKRNMENLISLDILTDMDNEESNSDISPALPAYTSPFVWRECVLADLLDQVHKLRQLESLLLSESTKETVDATANSSTNATTTTTAAATTIRRTTINTNTNTRPENLLVRLVYPLSDFMLHHLDDYFEKSLIGRVDEEHVSVPFRLPPVSPAPRGNPPSPSPNPTHPPQPSSSSSAQVEDDRLTRHRMDMFRGFFPHMTFGRIAPQTIRVRHPGGGRNNNNNNNNNNNSSNNNSNSNSNSNNNNNNSNNSNNNSSPSRHPSQSTVNNQRMHAITLELPHASTVLTEQDEQRRQATPSLLCPLEQSHYYAANPALGTGSTVVWQPLFQKTMCYCPVTRRRCIDVALCGSQSESNPSFTSLLSRAESRKFGFNPPHLLSCGHVISYNAMLTLSERPHRQSRGGSANVCCPYCSTDTPLSRMILLRCIY